MSDENKTPTLESEGIFIFDTGFEPSTCSKAIRFVLEKNMLPSRDRPEHLTFLINSPGGQVSSCFALIDTMRGSRIPIRTVGLGMIASCGLVMFMAGEKGKRIVTPNTSILSHQFSGFAFGKEHELIASARQHGLVGKRIIEHYKKCTGLTEKKIREFLLPPEDVWLTGEEAVKLGVADAVVATY